jgi:PAS domain S-box-containing protein
MSHVLIVEDNEENRNLVKLLLEANGYRVTAAGNGLEALAAARRDRPDAIVSDVLMPKMDGFALCCAWMEDPHLRDIPFIFYSATYVHPDDEKFALALGAVRYLIKPLEARVFLGELRAALQQWAGRAAPSPASPLDDATSHALHESALARKVDDKMEQLEAANRKLREAEEKNRRIYDSVQDVYVEASLDGTILEMSPQVATLSKGQYKREDLIGTSVNALYADSEYRHAILDAIKQRGRAIDVESMFKNRDGSLVPCSVSATIVRGADGELRTVSTLRDITRRKQAERALADSEQRFRGLVEQLPVGIFLSDGERLLYTNPRAEEIFGYEQGALAGAALTPLIVNEDQPAVKRMTRDLMSGKASITKLDFRARRKDGGEVTIGVQGRRTLIDGRPAIVGVLKDISDKKRT